MVGELRVFLLFSLCVHVAGHARLYIPASRSYMWRVGYDTPINYNDNELNCGGFGNQWTKYSGHCGVCGDPWVQKEPRENEAGGTYGLGIIVEEYKQAGFMEVMVQVTANHKGYFEFRLCPTNNPKIKATQKCLDRYVLKQSNGETRYDLPKRGIGNFTVQLMLPRYLTCKHCVLQWKYHTGNSYGCFNSNPESCCVGCGAKQEEFYSCADIAISRSGNSGLKVKPYDKLKVTSTTTEKTTTRRYRTPPRRTTTEVIVWDKNAIPKTSDECFAMCFNQLCTRTKCPRYCIDCFKFPKE